jgi:hypothetical protein
MRSLLELKKETLLSLEEGALSAPVGGTLALTTYNAPATDFTRVTIVQATDFTRPSVVVITRVSR